MNTEKLSLEIVSAYMPYRLKFVDTTDWHQFDLMSLYDDSFYLYSETESTLTVYFDTNHYPNIKPILRPMSDVSNKEVDESTFETKEKLLINVKTRWAEYNIMIYLISNHFDVFGLIERGLAISIHDLKL